jgi:hypothetical protein
MIEKLQNDIQTFLSVATWISKQDGQRVQKMLPLLRVRLDNLEEAMEVHMDLVMDLGWLVSKYERIHREAESAVTRHKAKFIADEYKINTENMTQHRANSVAESDPKYHQLQDEASRKSQWVSFLSTLRWSLKDRVEMASNLSKRNGGFGTS